MKPGEFYIHDKKVEEFLPNVDGTIICLIQKIILPSKQDKWRVLYISKKNKWSIWEPTDNEEEMKKYWRLLE